MGTRLLFVEEDDWSGRGFVGISANGGGEGREKERREK